MGSGCTKDQNTEVTPFADQKAVDISTEHSVPVVTPPPAAKPTIRVTLSSPNLIADYIPPSSGRELDRMPSFHLKAPETRDRSLSISKLFEDVSELLFSMDSNTTKFTLINDAWKRELSYEKEELLQSQFVNIIYPEDKDRVEKFLEILRGGDAKGQRLQFQLTHKWGGGVLFDGAFHLLDSGEITGALNKMEPDTVVLSQITNLRALNESLVVQLEEVNRKMKDLAIHRKPSIIKVTNGPLRYDSVTKYTTAESLSRSESEMSISSILQHDTSSEPTPSAEPIVILPKKKSRWSELTRKALLTTVEKKTLALSPSVMLRKSNLGAMMKLQYEKAKKTQTSIKPKILLIADSTELADVLSDFYEVIHARNEPEVLRLLSMVAFSAAKQATVDLGIIDLEMTGVSGFELFLKIRQKYFPNELPIIFVCSPATRNSPKTLEANDCITTPIIEDELRARVRNLVYVKKLNDVQTLFVPREFLDLLGCTTLTDIRLGKVVQKMMTVLFVDIRSFTSFAETLTPEENFQFINSYLALIGPCVRRHRGFIDKFMGDGTLALFPKAPKDAIMAAIEMCDLIREFRFKEHSISIGIGINTGNIMLGIMGEEERMSCDVISSAVNLASRVESLTKYYHCQILATGSTLGSEPIFAREVDHVMVIGLSSSVKIYEVFGGSQEDFPELAELASKYESGRKLYEERHFDQAKAVFKALKDEGDHPSEIYYDRCSHYISHPPDSRWNSVWVFDHK